MREVLLLRKDDPTEHLIVSVRDLMGIILYQYEVMQDPRISVPYILPQSIDEMKVERALQAGLGFLHTPNHLTAEMNNG